MCLNIQRTFSISALIPILNLTRKAPVLRRLLDPKFKAKKTLPFLLYPCLSCDLNCSSRSASLPPHLPPVFAVPFEELSRALGPAFVWARAMSVLQVLWPRADHTGDPDA